MIAALPVRDLLNRKQEVLAEKALVALTALRRLESERGFTVHESTRDHVRRALETASILFGESDRGRIAMLFNERAASRPGRGVTGPKLTYLKRKMCMADTLYCRRTQRGIVP